MITKMNEPRPKAMILAPNGVQQYDFKPSPKAIILVADDVQPYDHRDEVTQAKGSNTRATLRMATRWQR